MTHWLQLTTFAFALSAAAQTFTTLVSFTQPVGTQPNAMVFVQGADGNLYGTLNCGGNGPAGSECPFGGSVFKLTPAGVLTPLYLFCPRANCINGSSPVGGLVLGTDGNFYGTTIGGGNMGKGTVYQITPNGTLTSLHQFQGPDGWSPVSTLVQADDGDFYGTTTAGGAPGSCSVPASCGTVFKITATGTYTLLHSFTSTEGADPQAGIMQASDGNFYGTTSMGGTDNVGTIFRMTPSGAVTRLHSFGARLGIGGSPSSVLLEGADGDLYGTTGFGGKYGDGSVFKITKAGHFTSLHSFDLQDGYIPGGVLLQAHNENFYGVTESGGGSKTMGTIFEMTPAGAVTTIHNFCNTLPCPIEPAEGLFQATNGIFYGTTSAGGASDFGTAFSLDLGFGPYVQTVPVAGKVGSAVMILGNNLTAATGVTFNGTTAAFHIVSATLITTMVPSGSQTGIVQVTGPGGTLATHVPFRVLP